MATNRPSVFAVICHARGVHASVVLPLAIVLGRYHVPLALP